VSSSVAGGDARLRRYTGRTTKIRNSGLIESTACGFCGAALFDHQFEISRIQSERRFLAALSPAIRGRADCSAALKVGIRLEPGQRFGFHNFRHSLATFPVSRGKDVKTIQELLRHAKSSKTLDLYSQSIDAAKLEAQEDIALAIKSAVAAD
jgi:integrase